MVKKLDTLSHDELLTTTRRLLAEADALSSRIAAVNEISIAINENLDLNTILRVVAKRAKWLMDFDYCSICLKHKEQWKLISLYGKDEAPDIDFVATENIGHVIKYKQPKMLHYGIDSPFLSDYQSQIILPLSAEHTLLGTINFALKEANRYSQHDMRIGYMLSLQISSALRNANIVQELQDTQTELQMRIDDLDAYNHMIAHDLKSPLSGISLSTQIIQRKYTSQLPEKVMHYVDGISESTTKMSEMIDQLLWLARLRYFDEILDALDSNEILESVMTRFRTLVEAKGIHLTIAPDCPPIIGQNQWVEEVFANLISNAIKYMGDDNPKPQITIGYQLQGKMVRFEVCDTGIGITEENQKALFEMFSRVEGTSAQGSGLGLSIVRRIISQMNGDFGVESVYGEGSTFWFTLKLADEQV